MLTIGIPVHNALDSVKITVNSVLKNTSCETEIIVVDDGSNKETKDYLSQFGNLITNEEQKGFPYSCNLIMKKAKFNNICLLNSDTYCPHNWDIKIINALKYYSIVGPSSCRVCGDQLIKESEIHQKDWSEEQIEQFAIKIANKYGNYTKRIPIVGGFCFVLTKDTINKIGYFDESYGLGSYEETAYCIEAMNAGLKCGWVCGSYVHHYGHKSFDNEIDSNKLWEENRKKLFAKYGIQNQRDRIKYGL
jgi:O-antigen biosynthesis protein